MAGRQEDSGTAARLIASLRAGADRVDEGAFTLETKAALAKMEAFRYADTDGWAVHLVEGLLALGADAVFVQPAVDDLEIQAPGAVLPDPVATLAGLYSHAVGGEDPGVHRLAIGLDMALADPLVRAIAIAAHDPSANLAAFGELARRRPVRVFTRRSTVPGVRIWIDRRWIAALKTAEPALDAVRDAVRHCGHRVDIGAHTVSGRPRDWDYTRTGAGEGFRWRAGLERRGTRASVIEIWSHVKVGEVPGPGRAFRAELHLDEARRDLAQRKVVRDATFEAGLAATLDARADVLEALSADPRPPAHWTDARIRSVFDG